MIPADAIAGRVWRTLRSARVRAVLSVGIVLGLGSVGTLAAWSATTTTTSGTFTVGSVDLYLNNSPTSSSITVPLGAALLPNNSAAVLITVRNRGVSPGTYTTKVNANNVTAQSLRLRVVANATVSGTSCSTGAGTTPLVDNQIVSTTVSTFLTQRGPLAATSGSETLCMQFSLPNDAANSLQGASTTVVFTFDGAAVAGV
ncbi:SipW-dependent-type signal peptide-containing protein [Gordonia sp. 'Campus']|uniref:SipW-dependent-type signal peptide-containing protein n=1 Tax=Gordonia sp. 'Campus' TaxID=2915824 RepID=UPI001EE3EA6B|nr:SipW-dependent-type signal peptide-containing protein [Gordonia sp. 'Campus']